ncbi:MAG: polyphosphate polymerase domain-containing protein [Bacilli bacterium]|nr:polyphosphate polymerase domain-containing protein [Bacilli bacterium]
MAVNYVMLRKEIKYCMTAEQYAAFLKRIEGHMFLDEYGTTSIASIYYDTNTDLLIRRSIEKPAFKEKIRLRSYGLSKPGGKCYLELKRKAQGIVYKRRIGITEDQANLFMAGGCGLLQDGQIQREITYFRNLYKSLKPRFLIIYERNAYFNKEDSHLRITFDKGIRYRATELNLHTSMEGIPLLPEGSVLMEIKAMNPYPIWLHEALTELRIFQVSFSKVGNAYKTELNKLLAHKRQSAERSAQHV